MYNSNNTTKVYDNWCNIPFQMRACDNDSGGAYKRNDQLPCRQE